MILETVLKWRTEDAKWSRLSLVAAFRKEEVRKTARDKILAVFRLVFLRCKCLIICGRNHLERGGKPFPVPFREMSSRRWCCVTYIFFSFLRLFFSFGIFPYQYVFWDIKKKMKRTNYGETVTWSEVQARELPERSLSTKLFMCSLHRKNQNLILRRRRISNIFAVNSQRSRG